MAQFRSKRLGNLVQSDIRRMTRECNRLGGINLGQGLGDAPLPPMIAEATRRAIEERPATYTYPEGIPELRDAIAGKLARDNGIEADPTTDVVVTVGASGAFAATINALLDPGDGLLLMEPYYGYHLNAAILAGLDPQFITLAPPEFHITEDAVRTAAQNNTRAIVLCTPSNPSGKMFSVPEIEAIARVARELDLLVITDEIYEYIVYDDATHVSPATVADLRDRTVTIMGLSKTFSMTGWRLGYAVAPADMAAAITLVNDLYYICAAAPLQYGVTAGFEAPPEFYRELRAGYQRKRDMLCEALSDAGMKPIVPRGAYYVLADIGELGYDGALPAAMDLLERGKVAAVPGTAFYSGPTGESMLRFCFARRDDVLEQACAQLRTFRR